jgi:hypothetical protein
MVNKSIQEIAESKTVSFTIDELEAMENMTSEEAQAFIAQARKEQGI